jgi:hypothetical protein
MGGKKDSLRDVSVPPIKNSAGPRDLIGFLFPSGRSFSRERVRGDFVARGSEGLVSEGCCHGCFPFHEADAVHTDSG